MNCTVSVTPNSLLSADEIAVDDYTGFIYLSAAYASTIVSDAAILVSFNCKDSRGAQASGAMIINVRVNPAEVSCLAKQIFT